MSLPRHSAPSDFDVTGDAGDVVSGAVSSRSPDQDRAPTPRLRERAPEGRRRSPRRVLDAHLWQSRHGTVDDDLAENFADDVVVLSRWGLELGHDGMRRMAAKLSDELPGMELTYDEVLVRGRFGFLAWTARAADGSQVHDGADSYVIEDGRIVAQTIHYTVVRPDGG